MRRAAIIGVGARGQAWAQGLERAGWQVRAFDPHASETLKVRREPTISATVHNADWVVLCLPERLDLIQSVIRRAQAEAPETAGFIVVSGDFGIEDVQSGALRASEITSVSRDETGFVLAVSERTSPEIKIRALAFLAEVGDLIETKRMPGSTTDAKRA